MRFRHIYMGIGTVVTLLIWLVSDPDTGIIQHLAFGAGTVATIVILLKSILYVGLLHLSRRALIDYIDLNEYFKKAVLTSQGASSALIAVSIMMLAIAVVMYAAVSS